MSLEAGLAYAVGMMLTTSVTLFGTAIALQKRQTRPQPVRHQQFDQLRYNLAWTERNDQTNV